MQQYSRKIFVDMDGVLADFDKGFQEISGLSSDSVSTEEMWGKINEYGRAKFFSELPWMSGSKEMWNFIIQNFLKVKILSSLGKQDKIDGLNTKGKTMWLRHNIPSLSLEDIILVDNKHKKRHYSKPGDIIIDDTPVVIEEWIKKGGIGILHQSAQKTINQLKVYV